MKNPLDYQISKYDCGSTAMLNDASFRFQGKDTAQMEFAKRVEPFCGERLNL